jgi:hypothetical protein
MLLCSLALCPEIYGRRLWKELFAQDVLNLHRTCSRHCSLSDRGQVSAGKDQQPIYSLSR